MRELSWLNLLLLLLLLLFSASWMASGELSLRVDKTGHYTVGVSGKRWLVSGDTGVQSARRWLSQENGGLVLLRSSSTSARDVLGSFNRTMLSYAAKGTTETLLEAVFKLYDNAKTIIFEQHFPNGMNDTNTGDAGHVSTSFPSFRLATCDDAPRLGIVAWHGTFIDASTNGPFIGRWPQDGAEATGKDGGPRVLFDFSQDAAGDAVVLSAAAEFMSHTTAKRGTDLALGVMGSVESLPPGFRTATIIHWQGSGVNSVATSWGRQLLTMYGKQLTARDHDMTLQWLGYNTDHGAYYYYKTEPGKNYMESLIDIQKEAATVRLPFKYVLLDSWWYYKGKGGGVANWTVRPDIFPPGGDQALATFSKSTGWPIIGHNRYWSSDSPYAKKNGGPWEFSDDGADMIVPLQQEFWDWLLEKSKLWGLSVYEQDWLYNEFNGVPLLTRSATQARTWLLQMGTAATKHNLTIQYCMAYPRHALQSVEIPSVTQIRASDDYVPASGLSLKQWNLGGSSILAHALGLRPFKDSFWTTANEPGGSGGNVTNIDFLRHSAVATLTAGPVTPSDGLGFADRGVILRSCREDGRLLQPFRPATFTDVFIAARSGGDGPSGHLWATYSGPADTSGQSKRWDIIFASQLAAPFSMGVQRLTLDRPGGPIGPLVAYGLDEVSLNTSTLWAKQPVEDMVDIPSSIGDTGFRLVHFAPVGPSGWSLLGDMSKWVPVASTRVKSVVEDSEHLQVTMQGAPEEVVELFFADVRNGSPTNLPLRSVKCAFGTDGVAIASMPSATCSPTSVLV